MANATFWDKIAPKYFNDPIKDMTDYEAGLERIERHLSKEMRVLELGCGTGMTAARLAKSSGQYHATDIAPAMIEIAKENYQASNLHFDVMALEGDWASADQSDAVIALNLMHLVDDLDVELAQIYKELRKGGLFISKTVMMGDWPWIMRPIIKVMQCFGKAPHLLYTKRPAYEAALLAAGFEIIEQGRMANKRDRVFLVARKR